MSLRPVVDKKSRRQKKTVPRTKVTSKKTLAATIACKIEQGISLTSREKTIWAILSTQPEED